MDVVPKTASKESFSTGSLGCKRLKQEVRAMRIRKLRCSFCRETEDQISRLVSGPRLIVGPKLYICVALANSIMQGNSPPTPAAPHSLLQKAKSVGTTFSRGAWRAGLRFIKLPNPRRETDARETVIRAAQTHVNLPIELISPPSKLLHMTSKRRWIKRFVLRCHVLD